MQQVHRNVATFIMYHGHGIMYPFIRKLFSRKNVSKNRKIFHRTNLKILADGVLKNFLDNVDALLEPGVEPVALVSVKTLQMLDGQFEDIGLFEARGLAAVRLDLLGIRQYLGQRTQ